MRGVRGILPMVLEAKRSNYKRVFIPDENRNELAYVNGIEILPVSTSNELVEYVNGNLFLDKVKFSGGSFQKNVQYDIDFS